MSVTLKRENVSVTLTPGSPTVTLQRTEKSIAITPTLAPVNPDHGTLKGLADDDHAQYHTDARGDARYHQLGAHIDAPSAALAGALDFGADAGIERESVAQVKVTDGAAALGALHAKELRLGDGAGLLFERRSDSEFSVLGVVGGYLLHCGTSQLLWRGGALAYSPSAGWICQSGSVEARLVQNQDAIQAARLVGSADAAGDIATVLGTKYTDAQLTGVTTLARFATAATAALGSTVAKHELYSDGSIKQLAGGGDAKLVGLKSSAADPTTTEFPADKDWGLHKNTTSGAVYLAFNDGGVVKKVALS